MPRSEAKAFYAFYESNGWKVGRNPMRSWRHAITTWINRMPAKINGRRPEIEWKPQDPDPAEQSGVDAQEWFQARLSAPADEAIYTTKD